MPDLLPTPRASRYHLQCPLRFRRRGEHAWHRGTLCNMSTSGLLFSPDASIPDEAELEIVVTPPGVGSIWCRAVVVRREAASAAVGARITAHELRRATS
jgi:hypothetical protein